MKRWTPKEKDFVFENVGILTYKEIAIALCRSYHSVRRFANKHTPPISNEIKQRLMLRVIKGGHRKEHNPNWHGGYDRSITWKVNNAIRSGRLVKQPCIICGSLLSEAHHADYSKPLEVEWLCRKHHREKYHCDRGGCWCK